MHKSTEKDRQAIVEDFLRSGLPQAAYCDRYARERGVRIAPRTLRAWLKRLGPTQDLGVECRATIETAIKKLQGLLAEIDTGFCHPAAAPQTEVAQPSAQPVASEDQPPPGIGPAAVLTGPPSPLPWRKTGGIIWY